MARHGAKRKHAHDEGARRFGRGAAERALLDVQRLLDERHFDSIDDVNAFLEQLDYDALEVPPPDTPALQAQYLVYDAWDAPREARPDFANRALDIFPDCADALTLLAGASPDAATRFELLRKANAAAERALGPDAFVDRAGKFWSDVMTRPYVRATHSLAFELWLANDYLAAAELFETLIRLDDQDRIGARVDLARMLMESRDFETMRKLFARYGRAHSSDWMYARALTRFRDEGASLAANLALAEAFNVNPHFPVLLTGIVRVPARPPAYAATSDEELAHLCLLYGNAVWRATPGASDWFDEQFARAVHRDMGHPVSVAALDDVLLDLEAPVRRPPRAALRAALSRPNEATPHLLRILEQSPAQIVERPEYLGHVFAMFLLAEMRETRAYEPIVRLLVSSGELLDAVFDLVLTERMGQILASVSGGDDGPMKRLIEDESLDEHLRAAALTGVLSLVASGDMARADAVDYLGELLERKLEREPSFVWDSAASSAADLGAVELEEGIERAVREGLVEMRPIDLEELRHALHRNAGSLVPASDLGEAYGLVNDAIAEIVRLYEVDPARATPGREAIRAPSRRREKKRRKAAKASRKRNRR